MKTDPYAVPSEPRRTTTTTPAPSTSDGSAVSTTEGFTQMKIDATAYQMLKAPTLTYEAKLSWQGFFIRAIFYQVRETTTGAVLHKSFQRKPRRPNRKTVSWTFTVGELTYPGVFRAHELPLLTAFVTECHRRFNESIRGNTFNKWAILSTLPKPETRSFVTTR